MENVYILTSNGELFHHGVKGQKWGIRRYQDKSGRLTAAGKARQKETNNKNDRDHSKSDKSPLAMFAVNAVVSALTLNPIGIAEASADLIMAGKSYLDDKRYSKEREGCKVDKKTGLLLKNREFTEQEDAKRVNPLVHNFDNNTKRNCMLCTSVYDLRRRGYEVRAKKASSGYLSEELTAWYPKAKIEKLSGRDAKGRLSVKEMKTALKDTLVKQGNGARGNLMITWSGLRGGHSVVYEVSDGKLNIIDAQIGRVYKNPDQFLDKCMPIVEYARLDNIPFSTKTIKEVAE